MVFDWYKAWLFNRRASSSSSKPDEVLKALALKDGDCVIDVGVGGGFFALKFAEMVVSKGVVYGVDVNEGFLELLAGNARKNGFQNIKTVTALQMDSLIPKGSVDCIFLRNVYHHLESRVEYFENMLNFLKPDGRIAIIEYNSERSRLFRPAGHHTSKEKIVEEMESAGYKLISNFDFLKDSLSLFFPRFSCSSRLVACRSILRLHGRFCGSLLPCQLEHDCLEQDAFTEDYGDKSRVV